MEIGEGESIERSTDVSTATSLRTSPSRKQGQRLAATDPILPWRLGFRPPGSWRSRRLCLEMPPSGRSQIKPLKARTGNPSASVNHSTALRLIEIDTDPATLRKRVPFRIIWNSTFLLCVCVPQNQPERPLERPMVEM